MPKMTLVPVDHEPEFGGGYSLVPIDHNPFSADGMIDKARAQLASQPERFPTSYGNPEGDAAAMQPETYANPYVKGLIDRTTLGGPSPPDSSDPILHHTASPLVNISQGDIDRAIDVGMGAGPGSIKPIRAYHGSPHDFDRFDLSKIGTGEGAQAYGHGLYFAENRGTARAYQTTLGRDSDAFNINGRIVEKPSAEYAAANLVHQFREPPSQIASRLPDDGVYADVKKVLSDWGASAPEMAPGRGRMYEVNINADPAHFLDWDKPLNPDTLAKVQSAAQNIKPNIYERMMGEGKDLAKWSLQPENIRQHLTGQSAIGTLKRGLGSDSAASQALREQGIPGIKYLDQGSRAAGDGSRNYVVFNDKLVDIVHKYAAAGIALPPAIAAEYDQMKASQSPPSQARPYTAGLGL